jgi:hypothetical protein
MQQDANQGHINWVPMSPSEPVSWLDDVLRRYQRQHPLQSVRLHTYTQMYSILLQVAPAASVCAALECFEDLGLVLLCTSLMTPHYLSGGTHHQPAQPGCYAASSHSLPTMPGGLEAKQLLYPGEKRSLEEREAASACEKGGLWSRGAWGGGAYARGNLLVWGWGASFAGRGFGGVWQQPMRQPGQ